MKYPRVLCILLFAALLLPGPSKAATYFYLEYNPPVVAVGQTFTVTVRLVVDGLEGDPAAVCSYQYHIDFDQNLLQPIPTSLDCSQCPSPPDAVPPFYARLYAPDNCTLEGFPQAKICSSDTCPPCNIEGGTFAFFDSTDFTEGDPPTPICPKITPLPYPGVATAVFTFKALASGTAAFALSTECASEVVGCDDNVTTPDLENPDIEINETRVPALSGYGTAFFALLLIGSCMVFLARSRNKSRSAS